MKTLLISISILCTQVSFAQKQKITLDDDTIKVNGISYALIEKSSGMSFNFRIKSLEGKDLINFQFQEYNNPNKVQSSNPKGRVTYYEVSFLNDGQKCETSSPGTKKGVAKMVVENNLVKEKEVNYEGENSFVMINGMKFSEERNRLNGPNVIIIER